MSLHETTAALGPDLLELKRVIDSMREELEAVDWYGQRAAAASNDELKAILRHNRAEEIEHFAMLLEWIRRKDSDFDEQLRTYLFREDSILHQEHVVTYGSSGVSARPTASVNPKAESNGAPRPAVLGSLRTKGIDQ